MAAAEQTAVLLTRAPSEAGLALSLSCCRTLLPHRWFSAAALPWTEVWALFAYLSGDPFRVLNLWPGAFRRSWNILGFHLFLIASAHFSFSWDFNETLFCPLCLVSSPTFPSLLSLCNAFWVFSFGLILSLAAFNPLLNPSVECFLCFIILKYNTHA